MSGSLKLETPRLLLRPFQESDLDDLARINADPEVMRFLGLGKRMDRAETWRQIAMYLGHAEIRGYSILAFEDRATGEFLGRSGPWFPEGWPLLEVGWVVDPRRQGQGFATEAGRASLEWCFENLGVNQVCSIIDPANVTSARVAEKLGAKREGRTITFGHESDLWIHRRPAEFGPSAGAVVTPPPAAPKSILETARLRLRPFRESDLDALARLYADAEVMRFIGKGKTLNREQTWREMATFLGHAQIRGYSSWAIEERTSGTLVGECGPWFPEGWPLLELGWLVDPRRQGQGIATEAGRAVLDWCFANLGVDRVCSLIVPANVASARVAAKLGARIERRITISGRATDVWIHRTGGESNYAARPLSVGSDV